MIAWWLIDKCQRVVRNDHPERTYGFGSESNRCRRGIKHSRYDITYLISISFQKVLWKFLASSCSHDIAPQGPFFIMEFDALYRRFGWLLTWYISLWFYIIVPWCIVCVQYYRKTYERIFIQFARFDIMQREMIKTEYVLSKYMGEGFFAKNVLFGIFFAKKCNFQDMPFRNMRCCKSTTGSRIFVYFQLLG